MYYTALHCIALQFCNSTPQDNSILFSMLSTSIMFHWWNLVFIEKSSCRNCLPQGTMYCTKLFNYDTIMLVKFVCVLIFQSDVLNVKLLQRDIETFLEGSKHKRFAI